MAKKTELKMETLRRIRAIIDECGGVKKIKLSQLRNNKQYMTLHKGFMNSYERGISDKVLADIYDGKTDDEIQLYYKALREEESESVVDEKTAKLVDEMEQATESMFISSRNKVVEVEGPIVIDTRADVEEKATNDEDVKDLMKSFVTSTVEAGLKEARDRVEESVNDISKKAKDEIDKASNKNGGMLILSKGEVVGRDGTTEKICDSNENVNISTDNNNESVEVSRWEEFNMKVEKYRQPLIDKVGEQRATAMLTLPVDWDRVMYVIEHGPFDPMDFLVKSVNRGITTILSPITKLENVSDVAV